jgi:hypothetical protein
MDRVKPKELAEKKLGNNSLTACCLYPILFHNGNILLTIVLLQIFHQAAFC